MNPSEILIQFYAQLAAQFSPRLNQQPSEAEVEAILKQQQVSSLEAYEARYGKFGKPRVSRTRSRRGK